MLLEREAVLEKKSAGKKRVSHASAVFSTAGRKFQTSGTDPAGHPYSEKSRAGFSGTGYPKNGSGSVYSGGKVFK